MNPIQWQKNTALEQLKDKRKKTNNYFYLEIIQYFVRVIRVIFIEMILCKNPIQSQTLYSCKMHIVQWKFIKFIFSDSLPFCLCCCYVFIAGFGWWHHLFAVHSVLSTFSENVHFGNWYECYRIVRNKAAEKAKHVHHQQQNQTCPPQNSSGGPAGNSVVNVNNVNNGSSANNNSGITGNVSVIIHSGAVSIQQQQQAQHSTQTQLTTGSGNGEQRSTGYSINGILGIQHTTDPNGNSIKRKRMDGKWKTSLFFLSFYFNRFFVLPSIKLDSF